MLFFTYNDNNNKKKLIIWEYRFSEYSNFIFSRIYKLIRNSIGFSSLSITKLRVISQIIGNFSLTKPDLTNDCLKEPK